MWIMTTALLIYTATEYLMRKKMQEQKLTIPSPDHKVQLEKPSLMRLYQYSTGKVSVLGLPTEVKLVLIAMGDEWCRYYLKSYYQDKAF